MTKRKAKPKPDDNQANEAHDELELHAALIVEDLIPSMAARHQLCLGCFAVEIMRQLQDALEVLEAHHEADERIGETKGTA